METKKYLLRRRLIFLIFVCWAGPIVIMLLFLGGTYHHNATKQIEQILKQQLKNSTDTLSYRINEGITQSKSINYERKIEETWVKYTEGYIDETQVYNVMVSLLRGKFNLDKRFEMTTMFLLDKPQTLFSTVEINDEDLDFYKEHIHDYAKEHGKTKDTNVEILIKDGNIYLIRNLYTVSNFDPYGVLVSQMNTKALVEGLDIDQNAGMAIMFNNQPLPFIFGDKEIFDHNQNTDAILETMKHDYEKISMAPLMRYTNGNYESFAYQKSERDFQISSALFVDKRVAYEQIRSLTKLLICMALIIVPVLMYAVYFLYKNITIPVAAMIKGSKELKEGKLGTHIEDINMPNEEFDYLMTSFNLMSDQLKNLFDSVYTEKLARKDAKILALQSQINPHFLNNTLEMMNWQARMAGDEAVSKMIEALSTLLNHSMGRKQKRLIPLSEEITCAEAYFYIVSMRFGKRLVVEKDVDRTLLNLEVPQLILQPLLENAIKHGVETVKNGVIRLVVKKEDNKASLSIINTGKCLTKEQENYIEDILAGNIANEDNEKRMSLGIRNVNERLSLIFGEEYGLRIKSLENGETCAKITIPLSSLRGKENETYD